MNSMYLSWWNVATHIYSIKYDFELLQCPYFVLFFVFFYHASHSYFTTFERELPHCLLHCINLTAKVTLLSNYCPCQIHTDLCHSLSKSFGWVGGGRGGHDLGVSKNHVCGPDQNTVALLRSWLRGDRRGRGEEMVAVWRRRPGCLSLCQGAASKPPR